MEKITKIERKDFVGKVVSTKMDKTAVVEIVRTKRHPKYLKQYKVTKRYKVHDPKNECEIGELIYFKECRPLSKDKHHVLIGKVEKK